MKEKANNSTLNKTTTPPRFWRDDIKWRSTSTGINQNVINTYNFNYSKQEIIEHIRLNAVPYTDGRSRLPKLERKYNPYFTDVVNDCMKEIWKGGCGFVCNTDQLREVIKILPSVNVNCDKFSKYYYCWK